LPHTAAVERLGFGAGGEFVWTVEQAGPMRVWHAPEPTPATPDGMTAWVEKATGARLEPDGFVGALDADTWAGRARELESLGGPPGITPH
jgi:hypothetical protein